MARTIPFNKPFIAGRELEYIADAVQRGNLSGDGFYTQACSRLLEERFEIHRILLTPSCTAALEIAALLCDIQPGDEVILPSFTFVSTANAFVRMGARPVFVDMRPDTLNLDDALVESAITSRTKAIVPVHYAGVACEMDRLSVIAQQYGLSLIEDAAQGVHAYYQNRALGSLGSLGAYSFHETKNYTCGEGGALCINSPELVERAEILRDKGTNRSQFFRGEVDKYSWVDVGSAYVPSELVAAFLFAQLEQLDQIAERRRQIDATYRRLLAPLADQGWLELPHVPEHCTTNYHMFYVMLPDAELRNGLMHHLKQQGIGAVFHYVPLHDSPMGRRLGHATGDLPVTERLSGRLLRLPFYFDIEENDQQRVVERMGEYLESHAARLDSIVERRS